MRQTKFTHSVVPGDYIHLGDSRSWESPEKEEMFIRYLFKYCSLKDVPVHAPITCIKLGIPIYFIDHSEFITHNCSM